MDQFHIRVTKPRRPIAGQLCISGAKNAALPIIAASLLTDGPLILENVPHLTDVTTILELLGTLGAKLTYTEDNLLKISAAAIHSYQAPYELVKKMRASFLVLGPLLARFGHASVSLPGGCAIGARPVFEHLNGLEQLGASICVENGYVNAIAPPGGLVGSRIVMDKVSVTGTENLIMAAVLATGTTEIINAAREPEVSDLIHCLQSMGADIHGTGTEHLIIHGVDRLVGAHHKIIPDRIEAGTFLIAAALSRGRIQLKHVNPEHLTDVLEKLAAAGANITTTADTIELDMQGKRPNAVNITTAVYPGFPTDLQAQWATMNAVAEGSSTIVENIFDNRMMHIPELQRMGADITLAGQTLTITGKESLNGAKVVATDLRASACLVLAATQAIGDTIIDEIYHIDRGYEHIEDKFSQLGVDIKRIPKNRHGTYYEDGETV